MSRYTKKGKRSKIAVEDFSNGPVAKTEGRAVEIDGIRTMMAGATKDTRTNATTEIFTFARLHGKLWSLPNENAMAIRDRLKADDERGEVICTETVEDVIGQVERIEDGHGRSYFVQKGRVFTSPGMAHAVVPLGAKS